METAEDYKLAAAYPIVSLLDYISFTGKMLVPKFEEDEDLVKVNRNANCIIVLKYEIEDQNDTDLVVKNCVIIPPWFCLESDIHTTNSQIFRKGTRASYPLILGEGSVIQRGWKLPKNTVTVLTPKEFSRISKTHQIKIYTTENISNYYNRIYPVYAKSQFEQQQVLETKLSLIKLAKSLES